MADYENRHPDTVPGEFFTDDQCITCDQCFEIAPSVFRLADDGFSAVYQQPETPEEIDFATEAMDLCPVEAIGHVREG